MSKFEHLGKLDVKDKNVVDYVIFQIESEPVLKLKPATEANKPYFNAVLRGSRKNMRAIRSGSINAIMLEENRAQDRELFPKHVVAGWEKVTDSDGKPVPFSEENCQDFLRALPDWIFDEIRDFAGNAANFVSTGIGAETKPKN